MGKRRQTLEECGRAIDSLAEAITQAKSDLEIDGAIQRFEFTYELFWKMLKLALEEEGISANSPRDCFKHAYRLRWVNDEQNILEMIDDRNRTVHMYDKEQLRKVFSKIKNVYFPIFKAAHELLSQKG